MAIIFKKYTIVKRKIMFILFSIIIIASSCVNSDLDNIRERLTSLEKWQTSINQEITSLKNILSALENKDYATSVTPLEDGSGYVINFVKSGAITIKHGVNGQDASPPAIGVLKDTDGKYYWTLNGEWLLDEKGNKVPTTGENGGSGAIAPQVRINKDTNYWEISTDGGKTWTSTGVKATGPQGPQGQPGSGGGGGSSIFSQIDYTSDPNNITLTLADGITKIVIPRYKAFTIGADDNNTPISLKGYTEIGLTLPTGLKESDYTAIMAQVEGSLGSGNVQTKTVTNASWEVKVVKPTVADGVCNNDAKVLITPPAEELGKVVVLKVTIVKKDGSELSSSRPLFTGLTIANTAGTLKTELDKHTNIELLKVTGTMNDEDFTAMKALTQLKGLDLSETDLTGLPNRAMDYGVIDNAPKNRTLQKVILPETITSLGTYAFRGCGALKWINIPDGLNTVGGYAFAGCISLKQIELPEGITQLNDQVFWSCSSLEQFTIPTSVISIGQYIFSKCTSLQSIVVPENVTTIGKAAFWGCQSLETAIIKGTVEFLDDTFEKCTNLKTVELSEGLERLAGTFYECTSLENVRWRASNGTVYEHTLPSTLTDAGRETFYECGNLKRIGFMHGSKATLGESIFLGCYSLEFFLPPTTCTTIPKSAFNGCRSLKFIRLDEGITTIEDYAFSSTGLQTITFPKSLTTIGKGIFSQSFTLDKIIFLAGPPASVAKNAFESIKGAALNNYGITVMVPNTQLGSFQAVGWAKYFPDGFTSYTETLKPL